MVQCAYDVTPIERQTTELAELQHDESNDTQKRTQKHSTLCVQNVNSQSLGFSGVHTAVNVALKNMTSHPFIYYQMLR